MKKVLIIIVTYNAIRWVDKCLGSLTSSHYPNDVFVVDNGSTDGTQDYIKNNYPSVIFQQSNENLGFGRANNIGMTYALDHNYDFVYLLNQDAWIFENTIEALIDLFEQNPDYGILSPIQMQANLKHIDLNFKMITCSYGYNNHFLEDCYMQQLDDIYEVPDVMAAHWFLKVETLRKVGGFSPVFPHYGEDNNFCHRCKYYGIKIGIVPKLKVVHDREYRGISDEKKMHLLYVQNIAILSNPLKNVSSVFWIHNIKETFKNVFLYKSVLPFKHLFLLFTSRKNIKKTKEISVKSITPFL